ncbi:hypothetical protein E2C01_048253 [Portunus trituberculatus]|uniref:Uncharacterized protein n=1 Tax=Portunus trituberculatus TaxID=210409 RepID=A0A5B7GAN3_PORTR|nr:hypothetical protein [Portunus trituberculatus]
MPQQCPFSCASVFSGGDSGQLGQIRSVIQPEEVVFGYGSCHCQSPSLPISRSGQLFLGSGQTVSVSQDSTIVPPEVFSGISYIPTMVSASLSAEVRHSIGWTSMTFSFVPDFLAKTQCPGQHSFNEFTIPALLDFAGEDEVDHLLCPVRAVHEYLRRTRDCRLACSRLLVTVSDPRRAVHPHTLCK